MIKKIKWHKGVINSDIDCVCSENQQIGGTKYWIQMIIFRVKHGGGIIMLKFTLMQ